MMPCQLIIFIKQFDVVSGHFVTYTLDLSIACRVIVEIRDLMILVIVQNATPNIIPPHWANICVLDWIKYDYTPGPGLIFSGFSVMGHYYCMMTSSIGNIFRVTGHLCGEFTGHGWIPRTMASDASFDVFFDLRLNKWLSKQSWGWWFKTPSRPLWRHCNGSIRSSFNDIIFIITITLEIYQGIRPVK